MLPSPVPSGASIFSWKTLSWLSLSFRVPPPEDGTLNHLFRALRALWLARGVTWPRWTRLNRQVEEKTHPSQEGPWQQSIIPRIRFDPVTNGPSTTHKATSTLSENRSNRLNQRSDIGLCLHSLWRLQCWPELSR